MKNFQKRLLSIFLLTLLSMHFYQISVAQPEMQKSQYDAIPVFYCDVLTFSSQTAGQSNIEVYVHIAYNELRFVKFEERFLAKYEIVLSVYTLSKELVFEKSWQTEVSVSDFAQTRSQKFYSLGHRVFELSPGEYTYRLQLRDIESGKNGEIQRSFRVNDYRTPVLSISDVLVVNRFVKEGDKKILMPNIAANIMNTAEGFYFFFKVYSRKSYDSAEIGIRILNAKKSEVYRKVIHEALKDTIVPILIKVEEPKLAVGPYEASFWAKPLSSKDSLVTIATSSRAFAVRWTDVPVMIRDIDKAVEQLIYIARGGELDFIREAPTAEEKKKRFLEFWAKRDPDQNTERNELMEEYYRRVEYCNNAFASYIEGWRTDRGMVYIRFGAPENVERHPFEYNTKPYEVWYYYQQNRQFVFVDESGFGDYRLRYPTTDLWGRIR